MLIRWSKPVNRQPPAHRTASGVRHSYKRQRVLSTDPIIKGQKGRFVLHYGGAQNIWDLRDLSSHTTRMVFGRDLDEAKKSAESLLTQILSR
jgi:hypothetical protein